MKKQAVAFLITASMLGTSIGAFAQQGADGQIDGRALGGSHEQLRDHGPDRDSGHASRQDRGPDRDSSAHTPGGPQMQPPSRDSHREAHEDWRRGDSVPQDYRGSRYVINDWRARDLQPPPAGYHWLQINGDFVLAAVATGVIANILLVPHH